MDETKSAIVLGIDLDNTIISYDNLFLKHACRLGLFPSGKQASKVEVRDYIRRETGDIEWQKLQGKAYGEWISDAQIMKGFFSFIADVKKMPNLKIVIISHKTQFGLHDEKKIDIRKAALKWMSDNHFFENASPLKKQSIFFENTLEEKLARIEEQKCDYFIDDLPEVLNHEAFPLNVDKIYFSETGSGDSGLRCITNWQKAIWFFAND